MKCPSCGVWNRKHYTVCFRCGAALVDESNEAAAQLPAEEINEGSSPQAEYAFDEIDQLDEPMDFDGQQDPYGDFEEEPKPKKGFFGLFSRKPKRREAEWAAADEEQDEVYLDGESFESSHSEEQEALPPASEQELQFSPLQANSVKPVSDLSDYEQNVDLYDYTNWDDEIDDQPMPADEDAAPPAQPDADEQIFGATTPEPAIQNDEEAAAQIASLVNEASQQAADEALAAAEPSTKQNNGATPPRREVLVPAQTLSRDQMVEIDEEISREIIQAINTTPPPAVQELGPIGDSRPRRMMSITRQIGELPPSVKSVQHKVAAQKPKKAPSNTPEPDLVQLDALPKKEAKPQVEHTEPFALKDEIQLPKKPKPLMQKLDEAIAQNNRNSNPALEQTQRLQVTPLQPKGIEPEDAPTPRPEPATEAADVFDTPRPGQPTAPPEPEPVPEEEAPPKVEGPEWATNALRELNISDVPLERRERKTRAGNTTTVMEMDYPAQPAANRRSFGLSQSDGVVPRSRAVPQEPSPDLNNTQRIPIAPAAGPRRGFDSPTGNHQSPRRPRPSAPQDAPLQSSPRRTDAPTRPASSYQRTRTPLSSPPSTSARPPVRRTSGSTSATPMRYGGAQGRASIPPTERELRQSPSSMRVHSSRTPREEPQREQVNIPIQRNGRRVKDPVRLGIAAVVALLIVGLVVFGIVKGVQALMKLGADPTPSAPDAGQQSPLPTDDSPYTVVPNFTLDDGSTGYQIIFKGEDGGNVHIGEPFNKNVPIGVAGEGIFTISNKELLQDETISETKTVVLSATYSDASGKQTVLDPIQLEVEPAKVPIEILEPSGGRMETGLSIVEIKIKVPLDAKLVTVNGKDVTALVSTVPETAGTVVCNVENIEPIGDNQVSIVVEAPGYRRTEEFITIHRPAQKIALELDSSTPSISSSKTITIEGTVANGAKIEVTSPIEGEVTLNENGSFSFKAKLTTGENTITIIASQNGESDAPFTHQITYLPSFSEYTKDAYKMDYANLQNYAGTGRPFKCVGKVVEVTSQSPYTFKMNVGTDSSPKYIIVEMIEKPDYPQEGKKYDVYADVKGVSEDGDNLPLMTGRYWLDRD